MAWLAPWDFGCVIFEEYLLSPGGQPAATEWRGAASVAAADADVDVDDVGIEMLLLLFFFERPLRGALPEFLDGDASATGRVDIARMRMVWSQRDQKKPNKVFFRVTNSEKKKKEKKE